MPKKTAFKLPVLTEENYYSPENTCISNSKVGDYLLSPEYYYAKHVRHSIVEETTEAMELGKMVDAAFSAGSLAAIEAKWRVKQGRGDTDNDGREPVTLAKWEKAVEMSDTILKSDWYGFYSRPGVKAAFQTILTGTVNAGRKTVGICGKPDALVFDENVKTVYIDDLKTAALGAMRNSTTWFWHCVEFGYLRQLANYKMMVEQTIRTVNEVREGANVPKYDGWKVKCRHAVISSTKRGKYLTKLFLIPDRLLESPGRTFTKTVIEIANRKTFVDPPVKWEEAEELKEPALSYKPLEEENV